VVSHAWASARKSSTERSACETFEELDEARLAAGEHALHVAVVRGLQHRRAFEDRGVGLRPLPQPVERVERLEVHRLLAPERAVVVEDRDAVGLGHEAVRGGIGHLLDEGDDRRLGGGRVPRRQGIGKGEAGAAAQARTSVALRMSSPGQAVVG
jgi:hypothetical protein